jgi:hypothetical protein
MGVLRDVVGQPGTNCAWTKAVGANALLAVVHGDLFGELEHTAL